MKQTFGPYDAQIVDIHDGDTLFVDVALHGHLRTPPPPDHDLGFDVHTIGTSVILRRQSVRLFGCNAAELATTEGKLALAYLQSLVKPGDRVRLLSHGWDKYGGRVDGTITLADGSDLTGLMVVAGYAAPWDGKGAKPVPGAPA